MAGLSASAVGAGLIAGLASAPFTSTSRQAFRRAVPIALGGFAGALVDSILGATLQEVRFCDACAVETEEWVHCCGTHPVTRARLCDNDMVNALSKDAVRLRIIITASLSATVEGAALADRSQGRR